MGWNELLHPLSTLLTGVVFAFHLVFSSRGTWARGWQRSAKDLKPPFCSTLWTGFRLTSPHTVILWRTMRCPMILSTIGRSKCRGGEGVRLFRANEERPRNRQESRGDVQKRVSGLSQQWSVDHGWVSTGDAGLRSPGSVEIEVLKECWEFAVCSAACARRQIAKPIQRKSAQCSKSVFLNTVFTEQSRFRPRPALCTVRGPPSGSVGFQRNARWAHSLWPKIIDRRDRMSNQGLFKQ